MKIIIIGDDERTQQDIDFAIKMCWPKAKLICAKLGTEGIELLKSKSSDIVILDLDIADLNGFDVLKMARSLIKAPIIVLSYLNDETQIVRALELGADRYMTKPIRQMEFLANVRSLLNIVARLP